MDSKVFKNQVIVHVKPNTLSISRDMASENLPQYCAFFGVIIKVRK